MENPVASPGERATQSRYSLMQMSATLSDVIALGIGDPDLDTAPHIIRDAMREIAKHKSSLDPRGLKPLRAAVAARYQKDKGIVFDPEAEILITNGAQEGLFLTVLALVNPGDAVLVPDPRYSSYDQAVEAAGGRIVIVPTDRQHDFELESKELRARAGSAKLLIFPNPSNPTGALVPREGVLEIAEVARETGLVVVSDEVYEGQVYDGAAFMSVVQCEGMRERVVTLSAFSKTYAMTGFRVGYLIGPPAFVDGVARLKEVISGPCPLFSQCAGLAALTGPQDVTRESLRTLAGRRKVMMQGLDAMNIPYSRPGGAFFVWADISRYGLPADEFCRRLLLEARVLLFPGNAFGAQWQGYVRISLVQPEERVTEALVRIRHFIESLSGGAAEKTEPRERQRKAPQ